MSQDIFSDIAELEKRADAHVAEARKQAEALAGEAEQKLKRLAADLDAKFESARKEKTQEVAARRKEALGALQSRLAADTAKLEEVRGGAVEGVTDRVVRAFLEASHGD